MLQLLLCWPLLATGSVGCALPPGRTVAASDLVLGLGAPVPACILALVAARSEALPALGPWAVKLPLGHCAAHASDDADWDPFVTSMGLGL